MRLRSTVTRASTGVAPKCESRPQQQRSGADAGDVPRPLATVGQEADDARVVHGAESAGESAGYKKDCEIRWAGGERAGRHDGDAGVGHDRRHGRGHEVHSHVRERREHELRSDEVEGRHPRIQDHGDVVDLLVAGDRSRAIGHGVQHRWRRLRGHRHECSERCEQRSLSREFATRQTVDLFGFR
jgi:hypothetical protein